MLNARPPLAGVTLIELMVAIAVLAILLAVGLPAYREWIQNTQLRTAAESVLNGLQLARAEAVKRNSPVTFAVSGNNWSVTDSLGQPIQSRSGGEGSKNAVIAATPAGTTAVTFTGMGRTTAGANVTFAVTNPVGGDCQTAGGPMRCLNIVVMVGGQTRLCDPRLPSTDPQGC